MTHPPKNQNNPQTNPQQQQKTQMGHAAAEAIVRAGLPLVPYTLTGYSAGVAVGGVGVAGIPVEVVGKASRQEALDRVKEQYGGGGNNSTSAGRLIVVDYTTPAAALDNVLFYARNGVPFVMGTTGADAELVARAAQEAGVPALVAPQMGKQVVALQAALQMAAEAFPGAFSGYELDVVESHQASKVDVSGTAREVVRSLRGLGGRFAAEKETEQKEKAAEGGVEAAATSSSSDPAWHVRRVRDRATQQSPAIGVPYDALGGHAYHTYTLSSPGAPPLPPLLAASSGSGASSSSSSSRKAAAKAAAAAAAAPAADSAPESDSNPDAGSWSRFVFKHNVVGREVYARGTADAVLFLAAAARAAARRQKGGDSSSSSSGGGKRVFDMVDVLRAGDLRARAARARAAAARDEKKQQQPSASSSSSSSSARRANSPSVAAAAAASAAATRTAKEERAKAKAAAGESDA